MKLELKHLTCYLPYGVNFYADNQYWELTSINYIDPDYPIWANNYWDEIALKYYPLINRKDDACGRGFAIKKIKPILRPLSDLTKEIEHKGEKLVPLRKLEELFPCVEFYNDDELSYLFSDTDCRGEFFHSIELNLTLEISSKLFEWHFDVFGLIDKGLAIDINSLDYESK